MALLDLETNALLDRFASPDPTPGGGSASALAGATGAALVAMVCAMPKTRTGSDLERERLTAALGWSREAGSRLRALVDEDALAYDAVIAAYRLPKSSEAEKTARKEAVGRAMSGAIAVPLRTTEACLVVLRAAAEAFAHGNPNATSDARTAGALAWAGLLGAAENVRINLGPGVDPSEGIVERLEALLREGQSQFAALGLPS
ncbi:MAG TPA: cyclodeaminase/cyclohydrolase family protein [Vicinamibacteria bacterium]